MNRTFVICLSLLCSAFGRSCCVVGSAPEPVRMGDQNNIVIWDDKTQTEHFIRQASFQGNGDKVGFIAPTPSVPELGETTSLVFGFASEMIRKYETALNPPPPIIYDGSRGGGDDGDWAGVKILKVVRVSGYEAITVSATDSKGLSSWLKTNEFTIDSSIKQWLAHYVKKKWVFTAFVVKMDKGKGSTAPIRISFKTKRPFVPFLVPKSNIGEGGTLGVAFYGRGIFKPVEHDPGAPRIAPLQEFDVKILTGLCKIKPIPGLALSYFNFPQFPLKQAKNDLYFEYDYVEPRWPGTNLMETIAQNSNFRSTYRSDSSEIVTSKISLF